ncbi:hypothetical protein HKX48_000839 [Thoreauomyces humboldtii]|nr:hypothetical protein HKX48_000839 [Thoreauomyces humboldtii]
MSTPSTNTNSTTTLAVRPGTLSDAVGCALVTSQAYSTSVFYRWLCPSLDLHATDFLAMWRRRHARVLADRTTFTVVCEETTTSPSSSTGDSRVRIVGVSEWQRVGKGKEVVWESNGDVAAKRLAMDEIDLASKTTTIVNRAISKERNDALNAWGASRPIAEEPEPSWYLNLLAVDPAVQGRGIGEMLTRWGMERAERDGLYVRLHATEAGSGLYRKLGFGVVGKLVRDVPGSGEGELDADEMEWTPAGQVELRGEA